MSADYSKSGLVMRMAWCAVELQAHLERTLRLLGVPYAKVGWDVPDGWDSMPENVTLLVDCAGQTQRITFTKDELLAFPAQREQGQAGQKVQALGLQLQEKTS